MHSEKASWGLRLAAWGGLAFLHFPILVILLYAFNTEESSYSFPLQGFTLEWFSVVGGREDVLQSIVRAVAEDGRTVLFSSHLLDEVERIADHVALIDAGRVVFAGELEAIRDRHRRLVLRFDRPRGAPPEDARQALAR